MLRFSRLFIAISTLFIASLAAPVVAQNLPDGVSIELITEYPSMTQGVEKILYRKLILKPGATWTLTVPAQSVCQATKGVLDIVDHTSGESFTFKEDDRWFTTPGHEVTLSNSGSVDHEHLFYTLVATK